MKKNKLISLSIASLCVMILSSCGNSESRKWNYTKEDMSEFMYLNADLKNNSDNTSTFSSDTDLAIFDENIDGDDVIVFDVDKVKEELEKSNKDYADYSVLKTASVKVTNIKNLDDKDGFDITFNSGTSTNYGMLLHSSVTTENKYLMVDKYTSNNKQNSDPQSEFEEKYVSGSISWEDGGKFAYNLISNIGMILVGVGTENPTAIAGGIFGILGTITESFSSSGPTMKDIMDQLKETDKKIDELSAKIDRNTQQLADEIVRAEALVDQANLNTLNLAINDFATNSIASINTFNRNFADEVGTYYKEYVKVPQTVKLDLNKNDKGEYVSTPLGEMKATTTCNFSITIDDFKHAKEHLENHSNIVQEGFMDQLNKDVDEVIATRGDLPDGIDKENLRYFVTSMIYEEFVKKYFSEHKDKAQEYRNLMIEYAQRISGAAGKVSILSSYLSRLQYMYNFASEIKPSVLTLSANLLKILDMNTARASQACLFAEYDSTELEKEYKTSREAIQKLYKNVKEMKDSYSFTTMAPLTGGFYRSEYDVSYSNPGNHCTLNVKFKTTKIEKNGLNPTYFDDEISKHYSLSSIQHSRISTRWNLLRSTGAASTELDYLHYLANSSVISQYSINACEYLQYLNIALSDAYRILTSERTERDLNSNDYRYWIYCIAQGNPDGDYFIKDKFYNYRELHTSNYWAGKTFEASFVDAASGKAIAGTSKICSWARYAESHWYWSNDEYRAFINKDKTNYYFDVGVLVEE